MSVAGLCGNGLVIIAIFSVQKLRKNSISGILCSLAIADLLVCLLVMPAGAIQLATGMHLLSINFSRSLLFLYSLNVVVDGTIRFIERC